MCKGVLFTSISVYHVCAWCLWMLKRSVDPLELELHRVVSQSVGARHWTQVPQKGSSRLILLHPSAVMFIGFPVYVTCGFLLLLSVPSLCSVFTIICHWKFVACSCSFVIRCASCICLGVSFLIWGKFLL